MDRVKSVLVLVASLVAGTQVATAQVQATCQGGFAGDFPCSSIDLAAYMTPAELGAGDGVEVNDLWGWTDPTTGHEYALVGRQDGTAFVDVTNPTEPVLLGNVPTHTKNSIWRDIKVYANHAFIVADGAEAHGMQVVDLTQLRGLTTPTTLTPVAHYDSIGSAHNIVINASSGFGYAVGVNSAGLSCGGGLHMIDIRVPLEPTYVGCTIDVGTGRRGTGYTHDAQCVNYVGPDPDYQGREICVASNETAISIADVSDKSSPTIITNASYPTATYVHQGWFSSDQRYFYQDDELDERQGFVTTTRTVIWDLTDLDDPQVVKLHDHGTANIDHNMYVRGNRLYQAHYLAGLRISDITNPEVIEEVGYFDTMPDYDGQGGGLISPYAGAWSVYPFFESGKILVSSSNGLFVLVPTGAAIQAGNGLDPDPTAGASLSITPNPASERGVALLRADTSAHVRVAVFDILGREVQILADRLVEAGELIELRIEMADLSTGTYFVRAVGDGLDVSRKLTVIR